MGIDTEKVRELVKILEDSTLNSLTVKDGETEISLAKEPKQKVVYSGGFPQMGAMPQGSASEPVQAGPAAASVVTEEEFDSITSPMVGVFYSRPEPNAAPYVKSGDDVKKGQVLCILEAMKLMNEIKAPYDCKILHVSLEDGDVAEFGQVLYKVAK